MADESYRRTIVEQCAHYMRQLEIETSFYSANHLASWNAARMVFNIPMEDVRAEKIRQDAAAALAATLRPIHRHPIHPSEVTGCCGLRLGDLGGAVTTTDPEVVTCRGRMPG